MPRKNKGTYTGSSNVEVVRLPVNIVKSVTSVPLSTGDMDITDLWGMTAVRVGVHTEKEVSLAYDSRAAARRSAYRRANNVRRVQEATD